MARREWADKVARNGVQYISCITDDEVYSLIAKLLQAEHARAVRIVKAEIKRVHLDERNYGIADQIIIVTALERVLAALQKGRA